MNVNDQHVRGRPTRPSPPGAPGLLCRLALAAAAVLSLAGEGQARRLQVCAFSFQGPEELAAFQEHLPAEDFEIVNLGPQPLAPALEPPVDAVPRRGVVALANQCRADLRCDVVVISAEFAGRFFGRCGQSLGLAEMEEASCQPRCDGLFHTPREVFLLACNTLATKSPDQRTPQQYLQVLLDHGFDRASAERVVALRYGALGPTFREALKRIFMGVPRIYGFSSVAPRGQYTGPMLDRYFRSVGDYRRYLERTDRGAATNTALLSAFAGSSMVQTSGLMPGDPATADRDLICQLYDEREPVTTRLEIVRTLLDRPDMLAFVPSIQVFIDRHPGESLQGEAKRLFAEIQQNGAARDEVLALMRSLDVSSLRLELAHFAVQLGWLTPEELHAIAVAAARELLRRPLTTDVVDVMCELPKHETVGREFDSDDLSPALFADPDGVRLVSCLAPPDPRVTERLVAALESPDPVTRIWAAHALTRRAPPSDALLIRIAGHLQDPSPDVRERLEWIFRARAPLSDPVQAALAAKNPGLAAELRPPPSSRR